MGRGYCYKWFMADEFAFFKDIYGWDITVSLDFYTHAVVWNGRVVVP